MSNFRARESHVAQQSRRDKLRIQQSSAPAAAHHVEGFPNNLEQFWVHPELNSDVIHARRNAKLLYDSTLLSNSNIIVAPKDASMVHQDSGDRQIRAEDAFFANSSYPISSTADQPQQSCDWINVSNASGSANQNHMFVGEVLSSSCIKLNNINSASTPPSGNYNGFQDASSEISSQDSQKHYFNSPSVYQNTLQEVVTPASAANVILHHNTSTTRETGRASCPLGANELVFLPAYGSDHSNSLRPSNASASACAWINRPVSIDACHQWSGELGFLANKSDGDHLGNAQGLSLSLSSKPQPEIHVAQYGSEAVHSKTSTPVFNIPQDSKTLKSGYVYSNLKPSIGSPKGYGSSLQDIVGTSVYAHRNLGPLGPFTGYAAILKTSKFLKPAQQLLDEFCTLTSPKFLKNCDTSTDRISGEVCVSVDAVNAPEAEIGSNGGINSGASSSTFRSSNEFSGEGALLGSSSSESHPPEYQQKKAKLLYMQDEVCRRYKQYHQQMHMVVSSFESVAGLSAAAPYISLALKTVSRHFRCLKNAISDQLRNISKALGEDLSSPTTGASSSKGDIAMSRLKFLNQSFQKHKSSVGNMGFLESQQHIWRPQRGLPERAVAVLRAWLFEHFLHPYPTDTDKHMLATQTGLTRNQVSNWFINARVRVWKPMVEEIHMLETKGLAETDLKSGKNDGKAGSEVGDRPNGNQPSNKVSVNAVAEKRLECCGMGSLDRPSAQEWNQEKHSRLEGQIPASMDGSLMGFMPYQRNIGLEVGGLGAVSLTLGLRHGAETAQQQQQQENLLRQHFGGHMIHDFVG